jgi:hypothetical protein
MSFRLLAARLVAFVALTAPAIALASPGVTQGGEAAPASAATQRQATDEAVRRGMDEIRTAVGARAASIDAAAAAELAGVIEARANAILQQTSLAPAARNPLQILLGDMLDGTALMKSSPNAEARRLGLMKVIQDLNRYGRQFDHPGWQPLAE